MSQLSLINALNALQKTLNGHDLAKVLIAIRKDVEWPKDKDNITKLREKKSLKQIIGCLQSSQRNILNLALSILGNCLMDRDCSRDAVGLYNILLHLNQLLKRFSKDDSIIGRIFRIVGNLCQHRDQWANTILDRRPQIVTYIVNFVTKVSKDDLAEDEKPSEATILMAVRSLRCLLNSQSIMTLVKTFGALKAIGALFIKYCIEWQENQKNENILQNIIRLLQDYSRYRYYHSIMEMRNTERGDALVYLSSVLLLAPKKVVKIVMNFIRICQLKSELPVPEIFDKFIEILQKHSIVEELNGECVEYLQCLCYLLEHPANRNIERCGKCIPLLVRALKEFKEPTATSLECCILLIGSLNKYKYDEKLVMEQIKSNAVDVLLEKLYWLVDNPTLVTDHKIEKKRRSLIDKHTVWKRFGLTCSEHSSEPRSPSPSDDEIDFLSKFERSPSPPSPSSSSTSEIHYSWSWPSSSPRSVNRDLSDSDSDDYSPVCSEADVTELQTSTFQDEDEPLSAEVEKMLQVPEIDKKPSIFDIPSDKNNITNLKIRLLTEISKLIKTYIKLRPAIPQLASEDLLIALLKCSGYFEWQHHSNIDTVDIICRILDSHEYLITLMRTNFIDTIYNLTNYQHNFRCSKCMDFKDVGEMILTKLTFLAESGIGKGDIAHQMMRGDPEVKKQLVLVLPHIIRNKGILSKLLLNCGGLTILLKLMLEEDEVKEKSIRVLCILASKKLSIANPRGCIHGITEPITKIIGDKYFEPDKCDNVVTIKLDDGSQLKADREFLSKKSDFFSRLFNGYFKESSENVISLGRVDLKSFRCLLNLMNLVETNCNSVKVDLDLDTLLDVILLSDRFLMADLCSILSENVEHYRLTRESVPQIYRWALESGTNILRVECVAYALVANLVDIERFKMFQSLLDLGYAEDLIEDIEKLLTRFLSVSEFYSDENLNRRTIKVNLRRMRDNLLKC